MRIPAILLFPAFLFTIKGSLIAQTLNTANNELFFADGGQVRSQDDYHRISFRRSENIMELVEYGNILFTPGANVGGSGKIVMAADGKMGIGIPAPLAPLHVNGEIRVEANVDNGNIGGYLKISHSGKTGVGQARDWVIFNMAGVYGNSLQFWDYDVSGQMNEPRLTIADGGNIGIGTQSPQAKLAVAGDIFSKKVKVTQNGWPDYVFGANYHLPSLNEVEKYIQQNSHLPEVPSDAEVKKDGLNLGDNQAVLLKKIEEMTLYIIDLNKRMQELEKQLKEK